MARPAWKNASRCSRASMAPRPIPIENIYYLLSYAWDALDEAELANVSVLPEMRLQDLLASVLCGGVTHLLKRGLDRSYVANEGEIAGVRGKLRIGESVKRVTFARARAYCVFDELSADVLHNRIVKATLRSLAGAAIDHTLAEQLRELYRRMPGIQDEHLTSQSFSRVMLSRNTAYYRFLLDVCEIIYRNLLVDEATGAAQFRDFTRDDAQMADLFENFLRYFFERESGMRVSAPRMKWHAQGDETSLSFLPEMWTDIVLRDTRRTIVMDAKYYSHMLRKHFDKETLHSENLFQIFAYMSHLAVDEGDAVRGILLYPRTTETVSVRVSLFGYPFLASTIDLAQPWQGVRRDLLGLLA